MSDDLYAAIIAGAARHTCEQGGKVVSFPHGWLEFRYKCDVCNQEWRLTTLRGFTPEQLAARFFAPISVGADAVTLVWRDFGKDRCVAAVPTNEAWMHERVKL